MTSRRLLDDLPAIYQEEPFLADFLQAFEEVLLAKSPATDGARDDSEDGESVKLPEYPDLAAFSDRGLEEIISTLSLLFQPVETPKEFLPWLSQWTALSLRADLSVTQQRELLSRIVRMYRSRGTRRNLQELLEVYTERFAPLPPPVVTEVEVPEFRIGVHSTIGADTYLSGGPPHFFRVTAGWSEAARGSTPPSVHLRRMGVIRTVVELEKPAHTDYELRVAYPRIQIDVRSTIGVDTLIGPGTVT